MRMPPLGLLRTFEAAARHESFKAAAEELSVTPAAVSQQIRALEDSLGVALFRRRVRRVDLSEVGRLTQAVSEQGYSGFRRRSWRCTSRASRGGSPLQLCPPSVHWLLPRLQRFTVQYPSVEMSVKAGTELVDLHRGDADVAIKFGSGVYAGCALIC